MIDIVKQFIEDPRYKEYLRGIIKEIKEEKNLEEEISEAQAMQILSRKGKAPGARQMARYRAQKENALPYVTGRPITYIRKHVYEFRDKNFVVKRNNY